MWKYLGNHLTLQKKDIEKIIPDTYVKNVCQKINMKMNYCEGGHIFLYIHSSNSDIVCWTINYKWLATI